MRISVVADVHGNIEALARVAGRAERLMILGDLLDYVDYHEPSRGIMGTMFGADAVARFTRLRVAGAFRELHEYNARLWSSLADPVGELSGLVRERYRQVIAVVPPESIVILGNVDVPDEWDAVAGDTLPRYDGRTVELDGIRFGFAAGGVRRSSTPSRSRPSGSAGPGGQRPWRPFIRSAAEFTRTLSSLGPVDVICTHVPPEIPSLRYDVIPGRLEMAGPGLTDYFDRYRPSLSLFGHVHQPLAPRARHGRTECRHVGHFQRTEQELVIDTGVVAGYTSAPSSQPPRP